MGWKFNRDLDAAWEAWKARRDALLQAHLNDLQGFKTKTHEQRSAEYRAIIDRCSAEWRQTLKEMTPKWYEIGKLFAR